MNHHERSQERPPSFLRGPNGDMEEMEYFLSSKKAENLHDALILPIKYISDFF
jgi:hypothetical protein